MTDEPPELSSGPNTLDARLARYVAESGLAAVIFDDPRLADWRLPFPYLQPPDATVSVIDVRPYRLGDEFGGVDCLVARVLIERPGAHPAEDYVQGFLQRAHEGLPSLDALADYLTRLPTHDPIKEFEAQLLEWARAGGLLFGSRTYSSGGGVNLSFVTREKANDLTTLVRGMRASVARFGPDNAKWATDDVIGLLQQAYELGREVRESELRDRLSHKVKLGEKRGASGRPGGRGRGQQQTEASEVWQSTCSLWAQEIIDTWPRDQRLTYRKLADAIADGWFSGPCAKLIARKDGTEGPPSFDVLTKHRFRDWRTRKPPWLRWRGDPADD